MEMCYDHDAAGGGRVISGELTRLRSCRIHSRIDRPCMGRDRTIKVVENLVVQSGTNSHLLSQTCFVSERVTGLASKR